MALTFRDSDTAGNQERRLRRVPDYNSRPVKLRLFVLIAALMLVLLVAEKARDPKSWEWFFALEQAPAAKRIDNRLPPRPSPTAGEPLGTVMIASSDFSSEKDPDDESNEKTSPSAAGAGRQSQARQFDPVAKAWSDRLKALWDDLSMDERTHLYRLLQCAQDRQLWPEAERAASENLIATLEQKWADYHAVAQQSVAELAAEDQALWTDVLRKINDRFRDEGPAPLTTLAAGSIVLPDEQQQLTRLLADLDALNLSRVHDDQPFLRPDENQIWHHLFWKLKRTSDRDLAAGSQGQVAYAQLYRQPAKYRGQVVTVRGAARRAYRVQASKNHLGIKEYFVFWLQPFESADTPLVVYAVDLPPGFPPLKDRDRDGQMTKFNEEMTFHGYLFKRGAYAGQEGTYNAPLLLARVPQWKPELLTPGDAEASGTRIMWQAGAIALALAALIAGAVYWTSFRRARVTLPKDELEVAAALRSLQDADVLPSPEEALRQIERQAQATGASKPEA